MNQELQTIAIRYQALYVPQGGPGKALTEGTATLVARLQEIGFAASEDLLHAVNSRPLPELKQLYDVLTEALGLKNNWTPLVKGWLTPTEESWTDHLRTRLAGWRRSGTDTRLACGHLIPEGTFPLDRYTGCPYCGKPFETGHPFFSGQGSRLRVLDRWTDTDMTRLLHSLLGSAVPLDATQADTLKTLLRHFPLPPVEIGMKETLMLVTDSLIENGQGREAGKLFRSPTDILRYLWFKKTGHLQLIQPKVLVRRARQFEKAGGQPALGVVPREGRDTALRLKYTRPYGRMVACWLNDLPLPVPVIAEQMHPKREMWVRFIRALRLPEWSRDKGLERLKELLDVFYHQRYAVWAGAVNVHRLRGDGEATFRLLEERPGVHARSLLSNMLWFGPSETLASFRRVADQVPARLLVTLSSYAGNYFDPKINRAVRPLGGVAKTIGPNPLLEMYTPEQREQMKKEVDRLSMDALEARFRQDPAPGTTVYVDEQLFYVPIPVGDRSVTVHTLGGAPMGARFPIDGNAVRLFMQWGKGLTARYLDMDLSAAIVYDRYVDVCSYFRLHTIGARHSGDVRYIPDQVGTAEYIELQLPELRKAGARYVAFTCNAYSAGALSAGMVVGWMNSRHPMQVSEKTGVAYDPSCVQHQVRISQNLAKGLLFGVLDVCNGVIIWLEQSFAGQTVESLSLKNVEAQLKKTEARMSIGQLLFLRANARGQGWADAAEQASEVYDLKWAADPAAVTQVLIDR